MSVRVRDRKTLWARAGNRCSYRYGAKICDKELTMIDGEEIVLLGEECHIVGEKSGAARYVRDFRGKNSYGNLILLCRNHHKIVDSDEKKYTINILQKMKKAHENAISERTKKKEIEPVVIKDAVFRTEVRHADEAIGMEVNRPAILSNVRAELRAEDVRKAIGFTTNQGLYVAIMTCSNCGSPLPFTCTGPPPSHAICPHCGHSNTLPHS